MKMNTVEMKREIRRKIIGERSLLDEETRDAYSEKISENLLTLAKDMNLHSIFSFLSFGAEASIDPFIESSVEEGHQVYVPRTFIHEKKMVPYLFRGWDSLVIGSYGIREPGPHCRFSGENEPFDLVVVPGVAFTRNGQRLGYGGGYYDRFLSQLEHRPILIGICFEMQLVTALPVESHDWQVDYVVTENGVYPPQSLG